MPIDYSKWDSLVDSDDEPAAASTASRVQAPPVDDFEEVHRLRMAAHAQKGAEKAGRINALVVSGKLEEQLPALWDPDAPHSPLMEQVGYVERAQLKRSRSSARALKMGIATVDPAPWMSMFKAMAGAEAFPSRDGALGSRFTQLLASQMASHGRTRRAAILDALFFFCSGSYLTGQDQIVYEGWGFPGHEEGKQTFCYDSFEGGSGYDCLYIKKADPALYTLRWPRASGSTRRKRRCPRWPRRASARPPAGCSSRPSPIRASSTTTPHASGG